MIIALIIVSMIATICVALYVMSNQNNSVVHISGTVIPLRINVSSRLIQIINECNISLGSIIGDTIIHYVKVCRNVILVKKPVVIEGIFKTYNINSTFNRLAVCIMITKKFIIVHSIPMSKHGKTIVPGPIYPSPPIGCLFMYHYPAGLVIQKRCILTPGTYDVRAMIFGYTKNVTKPTSFYIDFILNAHQAVYRVG